MMTNKEIYELMFDLGMIDSDNPDADELKDILKHEADGDIVYLMNLTNDIMVNNDSATIEKFLIALLVKNAGNIKVLHKDHFSLYDTDLPEELTKTETSKLTTGRDLKQSDLEDFFEGK